MFLKIVSAFCLPLVLTACGSGSASTSTSATTPTPTPANLSLSGAVLGSFVQGALVCIDENANGRCDSSDSKQTVSGSDGSYAFSSLTAAQFSKSVVIEVPNTAFIVDPVTSLSSQVASKYRLSSPPRESQTRNVSSLSTLVNSQFLTTNDLTTATQSVVTSLTSAGFSVTNSTIFDNYVSAATAAGASQSSISLYNMAKLMGSVLQATQLSTADTSTSSNFDNNQLLNLSTTMIEDNIDTIATAAKAQTTIINQVKAKSDVDAMAENVNLTITSDTVTAAKSIKTNMAAGSFDLGKFKTANVFNTQRGSGNWVMGTHITFEPKVAVTDVHAYRKTIPIDYEIGLLDANGVLILRYNFHEPEWSAEADSKFYANYFVDKGKGRFNFYSETASVTAQPGDYSFVLCTQTCAVSAGRVQLATHTLTAKPTSFTTALTDINSVLSSQLKVYKTSKKITNTDGKRHMGAVLPRPALGSYFRLQLGVDLSSDNAPSETITTHHNTAVGGLENVEVPEAWVTQNKPIYARLQLRDKAKFNEISWRYSTDWTLISPTTRSSFIHSFDSYWYGEFRDTTTDFGEGITIKSNVYMDEGNPITGVKFINNLGTTLVDLCLPNNIPSNQSVLATYKEEHQYDGKQTYFAGCQNHNTLTDFGIAHLDDKYQKVEITLQPRSDSKLGNYLRLNMQVRKQNTNNVWGEDNPKIDGLKYMVVTFTDGSTQQVPLNLVKPTHDFSGGHGSPDISVCTIDAYNKRINWTPPSWLQSEYDTANLLIEVGLKAIDDNWDQIDEMSDTTQKGASEAIFATYRINNLTLNNSAINKFQISVDMGNNFNKDADTYKVYIRKKGLTRAQVLGASACTGN
jgi:hypothetical protein